MFVNTFYKMKLARSYEEDPRGECPLLIWAKDIHVLARISIAFNCKKPAIAVETYEVKEQKIA